MKKSEISTADINNEDNINIIDVILRFLRYWKLILFMLLLSLIIGTCYTFVAPKKYMASASILLTEGGNSNKGTGNLDLESLGLLTTTNNIDNEIALLTSPDLMLQVVNDLKLNYSYYIKDKFREIDIYKNSPYSAILDNDSILAITSIEFMIEKRNNKYYVAGKYTGYEGELHSILSESESLPIILNILGTNLKIEAANKTVEKEENSLEVFVSIKNPVGVADGYASMIDISTVTKYASTLSLKITTSNSQKGKDILSNLIQAYNIDNVNDKNKMALNTATFINERIADIGLELGDVEKDVEEFKKTQGITNLSNEANIYIQQSTVADTRLVDIETQIKIVEMIEAFIKDSDNETNPIPNIGMTDPSLSSSILEYNNKILSYNPILSTTSKDNPTRERILTEITMLRSNILDLVKSVKKSLLISKTDIDKQLNLNLSKIRSLPTLERGLVEKMRQQQIKENLYLFLLQKREESNIMMASNSDKAKIVIKARSSNAPVVPNGRMILLISAVLGIVVSIFIVYLRTLLHNKIESKEDLERISEVPVIAAITKNDEDQPIVVRENTNTPISELFRYLRNKIEFVLEKKSNNTILVTSTISGEGKTFVSVNLASAFALNNKKVLLIGMDIRNPQLSTVMNFSKGYGLTDYLSGHKENWRDLLVTIKDNNNLSVLQAGTIPPNPNELLKSKRLQSLMQELKAEYDVIIVDSAPLGIISDTYALSELADFTLYVVRENVTFKSAINFINEEYRENQFSNMYLLLNGSTLDEGSRMFGMGGYGYYASKKK